MKTLHVPHPGKVLKSEYMEPIGLSTYKLSKYTGISQSRLNKVLNGKMAITTETALRLAKFYGTTAEKWLQMQRTYDIKTKIKNIDLEAIPNIKDVT